MRTKLSLAFFFSLVLIIISTDYAEAQRRGRGPRGPVDAEQQLKTRNEQMKKVMELSDAQLEKVSSINQTYIAKVQELRTDASGDRRQLREKIGAINEEWDKELKTLVSEEQWTKWTKHVEEQRQNARRRRPGN